MSDRDTDLLSDLRAQAEDQLEQARTAQEAPQMAREESPGRRLLAILIMLGLLGIGALVAFGSLAEDEGEESSAPFTVPTGAFPPAVNHGGGPGSGRVVTR